MQDKFTRVLIAHRSQIRARWEALLRIERVNTPLANPDTLVYLFDETLEEIFARLRAVPARHPPVLAEPARGNNPLVAYFVAGEQALLETLILAQADAHTLDPGERDADLADLKRVIRTIARRDIKSLEGACQPQKPAGAQAPA